MGLGASQARLLSLTSRLSNLELQAQFISNSKMRLSDSGTAASTKYQEALNKELITVYDGDTNTYINATAYNLTTYGAVSTTDNNQRMLEDSYGRVIVTDDVANAYKESNGDFEKFLNSFGYTSVDPSAETPAEAPVETPAGVDVSNDPNVVAAQATADAANAAADEADAKATDAIAAADEADAEAAMANNIDYSTLSPSDKAAANAAAAEANTAANTADAAAQAAIAAANTADATAAEANAALADAIATAQAAAGGTGGTGTGDTGGSGGTTTTTYTYDSKAVDYYQNIYDMMNTNGYNVQSDENMNSPEWLEEQLSNGNLYLYEDNNKDGTFENVSWQSGDSTLNVVSDQTDIAKAEAEYNSTMSGIKAKDERFDLNLKNIDTEHSALQMEVDSVKKVIDKNIQSSLKMFEA